MKVKVRLAFLESMCIYTCLKERPEQKSESGACSLSAQSSKARVRSDEPFVPDQACLPSKEARLSLRPLINIYERNDRFVVMHITKLSQLF